jgi:hypothetical protein
MRYLASCAEDWLVAEVLMDYDNHLGDVIVERTGCAVPDGVEQTDDDRLEAFRRLVDEARVRPEYDDWPVADTGTAIVREYDPLLYGRPVGSGWQIGRAHV